MSLCARSRRCSSPSLRKITSASPFEGSVSASIKIDPQQIQQVLINLIQNAADSIGHDGEVTLRARLDTKRLADRPTDVVILEVADTGKGIPPAVAKRHIDPFFTTKGTGHRPGTSHCRAKWSEKRRGALQVSDAAGPRHKTFGIVLPRV